MADDPSLDELLSRWHALRASGQIPVPEELCAACPDQLEELKRRLRDVASMQAFLRLSDDDSAAAGTLDTMATAQAAPAVPLAHVGDYEILAELGRGGMGVVYLARQGGLKRLVALKMILAGSHARPEDLDRFKAEAEAVARLQHPNIVQIYEVGEHDGRPFFSLELVDGGSVQKKLADGPIPTHEAAALVETLARAVAHAHLKGIVHRDLKPANVLLGSDGTPKLTDFGLAKQLDDDAGQTRTGSVLGTPAYMAPEQAAGRTRDIGPLCDVYALGALLYETLTGQPPFRGGSVMETLDQVRTQAPEPPSRIVKLPRDLETICLKCLEKEPQRRYPSALALANDLALYRAGAPILGRRAGPLERLLRWAQREPYLAAAVAAALVFAAAVVGIALYSAREQRLLAESESRARADAQQRSRQALQESANLRLLQGLQLCEKDDVDVGLLWFAQALGKAVEAEDERLQQASHTLLAGWGGTVHRLDDVLADQPTSLAALSADGQMFAAFVEPAQAIHFWDPLTGQPVRAPLTPTAECRCLAFATNGDTLLSGEADGRARWYDLASGRVAGETVAASNLAPIASLALRPDGKVLAAGYRDGSVRLWDYPAGTLRHEQSGPKQVSTAAYSRDGKVLVTASFDFWTRGVCTWDADGVRPMGAPVTVMGKEFYRIAFAPDGNQFAVTTLTGQVCLFETSTGRLVRELPRLHATAVHGVAYSPDGRLLATGSSDKTARLWRLDTGAPVGAPLRHVNSVTSLHFTAQGQHLLAAGPCGVKRWRLAPDANLQLIPAQGFGPVARPHRVITRDGRWLLSGRKGALHLVETRSGKVAWSANTGHAGPFLCTFSPGDTHYVSGSEDNAIYLAERDKPPGSPLARLQHPFQGAYFSPNGRALAIADGPRLTLWDVHTRRERWSATLAPGDTSLGPLAFQRDGQRLLVAGMDGELALVHTASGNVLVSTTLPHPASTLDFDADGNAWIGRSDGTLAVHGPDLNMLRERRIHQTHVLALAFSADGRYVATASGDNTARVSARITLAPVGMPIRHGAQVRDCCFSPDGRLLLTCADDYTGRLSDLASGYPAAPSVKAQNRPGVCLYLDDGTIALMPEKGGQVALWRPHLADVPSTPLPARHWAERLSGQTLTDAGDLTFLNVGARQTDAP